MSGEKAQVVQDIQHEMKSERSSRYGHLRSSRTFSILIPHRVDSFVNKLRHTTAVESVGSARDSEDQLSTSSCEQKQASEEKQASEDKDVAPSSSMTSVIKLVDPSDPHATIRKLLKMVENLQDERDQLTRLLESNTGFSVPELLEENRQLHIELNNLHLLQEQNRDLQRQLSVPRESASLASTRQVCLS